jgi:hypothetical protein
MFAIQVLKRQEDHEFEANLSYIMRRYLKKPETNKNTEAEVLKQK